MSSSCDFREIKKYKWFLRFIQITDNALASAAGAVWSYRLKTREGGAWRYEDVRYDHVQGWELLSRDQVTRNIAVLVAFVLSALC
jgi:hypothetical protein